MNVKAYLVDHLTEEPVEGVSVTVVDKTGKPLGPGVMTDAKGFFNISTPLLDQAGNQVMISHASYITSLNNPNLVYGEVYLERDGLMETVVATFKRAWKKAAKPKYIIPISLGSLAVVLMGFAIKKKYF